MTDQQPDAVPDGEAADTTASLPEDAAPEAAPGAPAVDPTPPTVEAVPGPGALPADAPPPVFDGAAGNAPAGWYPDPQGTRPDIVRYWDGTAWTERWTQGERAKATYGEKYRRRLPLTILVVGLLNILTALPRLLSTPLFPTSTGIVVVLMVVSVVGIILGGALWNLLVAVFPGQPSSALGKPRLPRPWVWAVVVALVAGPLAMWSLYRPATVAAVTISSPAEACQQFLAVNVEAAKAHTKVISMGPYYQSLADASRTSDPAFSAEMQKVADNPTSDGMRTATSTVIARCITEGNLTREQVTAFIEQLRATTG